MGRALGFAVQQVFMVLLLAGSLSAFANGQANAQTTDEAAYCSANGKVVLFLVDMTTPYDQADKEILVDGLQRTIDGLSGGDRIVIRTIKDDFSHTSRIVSACVPYCKVGSWLDWLLSSCTEGVVLNRKRALVSEIRNSARRELDSFEELPNSDIIRTLNAATQETLVASQPAEVYLFSDMIENSLYMPGKEFLSGPNGELLSRVKRDNLVPDLSNVGTVRIFGVGRGGEMNRTPLPLQLANKIVDFWKDYFSAAGAKQVSISQSLPLN